MNMHHRHPRTSAPQYSTDCHNALSLPLRLFSREFREDQVATAPRLDRPCFLTSWCHSTALGVLLCGWNDGAVVVVNPRAQSLSFRLRRSQKQQQVLLPPGGTCVPTTAVGLIPLSLLLQHAGNQVFADTPPEATGGREGVVALVGNADGNLALWPAGDASCRPWNLILAHTDAVIAIRTAMDAPQSALEHLSGVNAAPPCRNRSDTMGSGGGSSFFVVTAGTNCEVKVWGIDTAERQDMPPLTLAGYTVVGNPNGGRLTALELLSEGHMACGFDSGAVEVWSIPFTSRGGVLASTREAVQAFPRAHGTKVTSIVVSFGMGFRRQGDGGIKAGRVVLTTSADRTVVRWVSMAPGDNLRPVSRYCLSEEPAVAVLLPPAVAATPTATSGRYNGVPFPPKTVAKVNNDFGDVAAVTAVAQNSEASTLFRVVAALNGIITVLDLVTVETLIGEDAVCGAKQSRKLCPAVANAFPGTPFIPRLPPPLAGSGTRSEQSGKREPGSSRWRVGGAKAREVGRYDVLGGIEGSLLGWEASGKRRMVLTAASRKAWVAHFADGSTDEKGPSETGPVQPCWGDGDKKGEARQAGSPPNQLGPEASKGKRRKRSRGRAVKPPGGYPIPRRSATVQPSVKVLTICPAETPGERGTSVSRAAHDHDRKHAYRKVSGGKIIKLDPRFAAATAATAATADREKLLLQQESNGDGTINHLSSPGIYGGDTCQAERQNAGAYSMELAVPNLFGPSDAPLPTGGENDLSAVAISFQGIAAASVNGSDYYSSRFQHAPSSPPPSYANADTNSMLGLSASTPPPRDQEQFSAKMTDSNPALAATSSNHLSAGPASATGGGDAGSPTEDNRSLGDAPARLGDASKQPQLGDQTAFSVHAGGSAPSSRQSIGHDNDNVDHHNNKKEPTPMNAVVAAASAARSARDAWDTWRRKAPVVIERRPPSSMQERLQFNFDSAQAPSSGMSGVGVAVPRGYADEK